MTGVADSEVFGLAPEFALLSGPRGARCWPCDWCRRLRSLRAGARIRFALGSTRRTLLALRLVSQSSCLLEQCDVFVAFAEDLVDVAAEPVEAGGEHQPGIELRAKIAVKEVAGVECPKQRAVDGVAH